jgi:site-specific recombinase XerC
MTEAVIARPPSTIVLAAVGPIAVPSLIVDAGSGAADRFLEFFAGQIANAQTRGVRTSGRAVSRVLRRPRPCARAIAPLHVAAFIRSHPGVAPTVKQHLAAIRVLCDWLVVSQILPANPAAAVRGPNHIVTEGSTPVLTAAEARALLDGIDLKDIVGLRDRALIGVMVYSLRRSAPSSACASGTISLRAGVAGSGCMRRRQAARRAGALPRRDLPGCLPRQGCAHRPQGAAVSERGSEAAVDRLALQRREVLAMVKRRAAAADLPGGTCCHTFRATGITAYLSNGGTLEHAQQIAAHASPKTTKLYDRTADTVPLDEIERIVV